MNLFVPWCQLPHPPMAIVIVVYKNKAQMLLPNACRISLIYFLHILTIITVFNNFKKKIIEVTYNCCTQNVEILFAYLTSLFACLQITAQVYSLTTSCIIFSTLSALK